MKNLSKLVIPKLFSNSEIIFPMQENVKNL